MATEVLMPALSPTMTEGKITRWLKKEGDKVASGDVLAEIETDKATMEFESAEDGILGRILVPQGTEGIAVGVPIALIVQKGEAVPATLPKDPAHVTSKPSPAIEDKNVLYFSGASSSSGAVVSHGSRIIASPLARRIAKEKGIDLATLKGSGPHGRILRRDVEALAISSKVQPAVNTTLSCEHASTQQTNQAALLQENLGGGSYKVVPHTTMRKVIARRLTESKSTIPHFYVSVDVELDALLALRTQLNSLSNVEGAGAFKLSVNDMLIKASAIALKQVPEVNATYTEEAMVLYDNVDISVAVSLDDGLITPIIRQAELKSLKTISLEAKELISRARAGKLKPEEFQGGTFSISNMGMYGVKNFSAVVNPPQSAILAVSAAQQQAVVVHGELKVATVMTVTLSVDHRAVDGATAAKWLAAFKTAVQSPMTLVL